MKPVGSYPFSATVFGISNRPDRNRRRKCNFAEGQSDCIHCIARHQRCVKKPPVGGYYHQSNLASESRQLEQGLDASNDVDSYPPLVLRVELVRLYFEYIHNQFHTLFHPPSFQADVAEDRVERVLLYPIFALSARSVDYCFPL